MSFSSHVNTLNFVTQNDLLTFQREKRLTPGRFRSKVQHLGTRLAREQIEK